MERTHRDRPHHGSALTIWMAFAVVTACSSGERAAAQEPTGSAAQNATTRSVDWSRVDQVMGLSGKMQSDGAYKYSVGRSDLHVTVGSVAIKPALALGSWLAMKPGINGVVAMGDLVLTEDEIGPVMIILQAGGIMQTALHNHLAHESPRVLYMHIHAEGDPVKIARSVHDALARTKTPMSTGQPQRVPEAPLDIDTAGIDRVLGRRGNTSGGVYHVSVPRADTIRDAGIDVPPSMGTATAINFQPTGSGRAAINGDFVMTANEVNPVIRALEDNGIHVVALHNHMLGEQPRLFFMHYWANDDALQLARGLRAALDKMNTK